MGLMDVLSGGKGGGGGGGGAAGSIGSGNSISTTDTKPSTAAASMGAYSVLGGADMSIVTGAGAKGAGAKGLPWWVWPAGLALVAVLWIKRKG